MSDNTLIAIGIGLVSFVVGCAISLLFMWNRGQSTDMWNARDILGFALILAFIGAMVALLWKAIPTENEQLLSYMLGQLSGFVGGVIGYHYITKAGEKELDAKRAENTGKALDIAATLGVDPAKTGVGKAVDEVVGAAEEKADEIKEGKVT